MEDIVLKAKESGLLINNINDSQWRFAKYLQKQYSKGTNDYDEDIEFRASCSKNADLLALRYLELVSHPDYGIKENVVFTSRFKVETRGRRSHKIPQEIISRAYELFASGRSAEDVSKLLEISHYAATKLRDKALENGGINYSELKRKGKPYLKNDGKKSRIKELFLKHPEYSFVQVENFTQSSPQYVKSVWLDMVKNDDISGLLKYNKLKFVGNRSFVEVEEEWIRQKASAGFSEERIASAIKASVLKIRKVLSEY